MPLNATPSVATGTGRGDLQLMYLSKSKELWNELHVLVASTSAYVYPQ
jgi:hypothetical protein